VEQARVTPSASLAQPYWLRRLASLCGLVMASSAFTFLLLEAAPGDFLSEAQMHPQMTESAIAALRERYGLDQPLGWKYATWLMGLWQGDWGRSLARDVPVGPLLWERAGRTASLTAAAQAVAWLVALALSTVCLRRPGGALDRALQGVCHILLSLPEIVIALLVLLAMVRGGAGTSPLWVSLIALVLALAPALWRQVRTALLEAAEAPFVSAARDNEVPERIVIARYILPAAAPGLVALAGLSIGSLLSKSLLVECIAGYPGLGPLLLDAVLARDVFVVVGAVFLSTLLWAVGSLAADLLHVWVNPRLRATA
jgi:peptide/nickel transport system permease protein